MAAEKQSYNVEEIKKIAPGYKGKPENFDPAKAKGDKLHKVRAPKPVGRTLGPASPEVKPPTHAHKPQTPTPQRNEKMVSEAVFGVDVSIFPIDPRQIFEVNNAHLPQISREVYQSFAPDDKQLDRVLAEPEFLYCTTSMYWLRLLEIKAKQGRTALTSAEKDLRKATQLDSFNVPQPIHIYLAQLGNIMDAGGKETELNVPALPVTAVGGFGGYHTAAITQDTHSLFEEVPSLGIAADAVMALQTDNQAPNYRVAVPNGARINTTNLTGGYSNIANPRDEIKRRLTGQGITSTTFPEFVQNTRFNLKYVRQISDIVGRMTTFRNKKLNIASLTTSGASPQIIETYPADQGIQCQSWITIPVEPRTAFSESTANVGASYIFGFQTYKEPGAGADITAQSQSWSCVDTHSGAAAPWAITNAWARTRNAHRQLPPGIGSMRFRSLIESKTAVTENVVRRG